MGWRLVKQHPPIEEGNGLDESIGPAAGLARLECIHSFRTQGGAPKCGVEFKMAGDNPGPVASAPRHRSRLPDGAKVPMGITDGVGVEQINVERRHRHDAKLARPT